MWDTLDTAQIHTSIFVTTLFQSTRSSCAFSADTRTPSLEAPATQDERDGYFVVTVSIVFTNASIDSRPKSFSPPRMSEYASSMKRIPPRALRICSRVF